MSNGDLVDVYSGMYGTEEELLSQQGNQAMYGEPEFMYSLPTGNLDLVDGIAYSRRAEFEGYPIPSAISNAPSKDSLTDVLGKVLNVAGQTFSDIMKVKYAQTSLKTVPAVQSGAEKYLYGTAKTAQTGLPLTTYATGQGSLIGGIPNIYLIVGVALVLVFIAMR